MKKWFSDLVKIVFSLLGIFFSQVIPSQGTFTSLICLLTLFGLSTLKKRRVVPIGKKEALKQLKSV